MVLVHIRTVFDHKRHNQYILCHYLAFISRRFESYVILSEHIMANAWHVGIYSMSHLVKCCNKVSWYHGCVWWPLSLSLFVSIYRSIYQIYIFILARWYICILACVWLHWTCTLTENATGMQTGDRWLRNGLPDLPLLAKVPRARLRAVYGEHCLRGWFVGI